MILASHQWLQYTFVIDHTSYSRFWHSLSLENGWSSCHFSAFKIARAMSWIGIRGFSELNFLVLKWSWLYQQLGDQVTRNGSTFKDFSRHHWTCVAQSGLLGQIFCFRKLLRFDRNLQKNDYIQLSESKWKDSWKHGAFYDPCRSWKPLKIWKKRGNKKKKIVYAWNLGHTFKKNKDRCSILPSPPVGMLWICWTESFLFCVIQRVYPCYDRHSKTIN